MNGVQSGILPVLHWVIETLKDGGDCFRLAAEDAQSEEIHAFFDRLCRQRAQFAAELAVLAASLGEMPPERPEPAGGKPLCGFYNDRALLMECDRYEREAAFAYRHVLAEEDLPGALRQVLERHAAEIAESSRQIRSWSEPLAR